jgi:hypothetical protein
MEITQYTGEDLLTKASLKGYIDIVQMLLDQHGIPPPCFNNKSIRFAISKNDIPTAKMLLLNKRFDFNLNVEDIFLDLVAKGCFELVQILLNNGVDPSLKKKLRY